MKKRLFLLLTVLIVSVMSVGAIGTSAWFTDIDSADNTFTAGTLSVKLGGPAQAGITITAPAGGGGEIGGMAPGEEFGPYLISVVNEQNPQSTLPAKYRLTSELLSGDVSFFDQLNVRVVHGNCIGNNEVAYNGGEYDIFDGPLADLLLISNDNSSPYQSGWVISSDGLLNPQNTHCFEWYFMLDELADNTAQGDTIEFLINLDATQADNPGWTES